MSDKHGFGVVIEKNRWRLYFGGKALSSWRLKSNNTGTDYLDLASLNDFCSWLANNWTTIAYGGDFRPAEIRDSMVAASRAYESAELVPSIANEVKVTEWWTRHAIRAANNELPTEAESSEQFFETAQCREWIQSCCPQEPWESGYRLARLVRERLGLAQFEKIAIELVLENLGVETHELSFESTEVLGACIGTPGFCPMVVLNTNCKDSSGLSGKRVTLAHELCHLLFDRAGMRSLARFEGGSADSDRLIEMRANAFAVELLVPMHVLIEEGKVVEEPRLAQLAEQWEVSFHALKRHARNLRNRLMVGTK